MGITAASIELLQKHSTGLKTVLELGAQNLYDKDYNDINPYASDWYYKNGILFYHCIDLNGENYAEQFDLSKKYDIDERYDLVTDFGTSEHIGTDGKFNIEAIYNCWWNKHNWLNPGGIMINENPKTGNWPKHGFNYYTEEFYKLLVTYMGYEILELGSIPAMGNTRDGWNVYCVLKKITEREFIDLNYFKKLGIKTK